MTDPGSGSGFAGTTSSGVVHGWDAANGMVTFRTAKWNGDTARPEYAESGPVHRVPLASGVTRG